MNTFFSVTVEYGPPIDALYEFSGTLRSVKRYKAPGDAVIDFPAPASPEARDPNASQGAVERSDRRSTVKMSTSSRRFDLHRRVHPTEEVEVLSGQYQLDLGQFMLRGTSLVNTSWVYGLVVYVSKDTRIFQNANTKVSWNYST